MKFNQFEFGMIENIQAKNPEQSAGSLEKADLEAMALETEQPEQSDRKSRLKKAMLAISLSAAIFAGGFTGRAEAGAKDAFDDMEKLLDSAKKIQALQKPIRLKMFP